MAAILLVADDLTQYAWHRASHTPLLWPLHRAHHTAHYMSIRITYRNNFFYYLMMPGLWISGVLDLPRLRQRSTSSTSSSS